MNTTTAPTLDSTHRCDRCGAQAYVHARFNGGELYFCAHHARTHRDKLSGVEGIEIHDETDRLEPSQD